MSYTPRLDTLLLALDTVADPGGGLGPDCPPDLVASILAEAGRFASERIAPLNRQGDTAGARFAGGSVTLPDGWRDAYRDWAGAGWNSVDMPVAWGGMGLPVRLGIVAMEIWNSACMAFALGPVLTQGAVDALDLHASDDLKARYLAKLVSGEWTATMNLTEPQAGSDLGLLRTRAVPAGDGSYRISGQKIFITWGEHDLADNIIHLVLARLPDAPEGTRGISLFVVPKFLPDTDGVPGARNDVVCAGIEHKLGIHASPTCTMVFGEAGGATGWLVGAPHRGLACMFTMMNRARLQTGLQGVAIAELAYQKALAYARERRQGRAPGVTGGEPSPILVHPDVRRNLATMRALTAAGRAIACHAARAIDLAQSGVDEAARRRGDELAGLLTPIAKATCTEIGVEAASIGMQVHGGMGYVEETGAAQLLRDARIAPIYEGTNGIQAIDLVTRKVLRPGSSIACETIAALAAIAASARASRRLAEAAGIVAEACRDLSTATDWLAAQSGEPELLLGAATPYLKLWGVVAGAAWLLETALLAEARQATGSTSPVVAEAIGDARFFALNIAVQSGGLARIVTGGRVPDLSSFG